MRRAPPALKIFATGLALILMLPLAYFWAALLGGIVPANVDWREPGSGVPVFVRTNGVHTWLVLPVAAAGVDWRPLVRPEHIRDPARAGNYLAFGFGNREFYLNTPTWWDLSPRTALAAAFGDGPGLVHVEHARNPRPNERQRRILLTPDRYRVLASHIRGSFNLDFDGRSQPLLGRGYSEADIFYEARGRYDAHRTCNEWTGEALRAAGVRMGIWTPLSESVMLRLPKAM